VISTLKVQIDAHEEALEQRIKGLMEARTSSDSLKKQIDAVSTEYNDIAKQCKLLDDTLLKMMKAMLQASKIKEEQAEKERQMKELNFEGLYLYSKLMHIYKRLGFKL